MEEIYLLIKVYKYGKILYFRNVGYYLRIRRHCRDNNLKLSVFTVARYRKKKYFN